MRFHAQKGGTAKYLHHVLSSHPSWKYSHIKVVQVLSHGTSLSRLTYKHSISLLKVSVLYRLCPTLADETSGSNLRIVLVGQTLESFLWVKPVAQIRRTWVKLVGQACGSNSWVILVGQTSESLSWIKLWFKRVSHSRRSDLFVKPVGEACWWFEVHSISLRSVSLFHGFKRCVEPSFKVYL